MKLRWYDRILVALGGLVLIALGVIVILTGSGVISDIIPGLAIDTWLGNGWQWTPLVILVGILLLVWGLWLFIRPFRKGSEGRGKYYTLQNEPEGNVRISVHAIDRLVYRCIEKYGQILAAKVRIGGSEDAMRITIHMTVRSDVRIPALVEELREDIKRSLDHSAGVTVETVEIYVDATRDDKNARDEIKYIEASTTRNEPEPEAAVPQESTQPFYAPPVIVTSEKKPEEEAAQDAVAQQPEESSVSVFSFQEAEEPEPEEEAEVPESIYAEDLPIADESPEEQEETEDAGE